MVTVKISRVDIYEYSLSMKQPLAVKGNSSLSREGLLLRLWDDDGNEGWGEVAPLEGFSLETLDLARHQLVGMKQDLSGVNVDELFAAIVAGEARPSFIQEICPSVEFGVGSALLYLVASNNSKLPGEILAETVTDYVPVNALLDGSSRDIVKTALTLYESGYRTFKVKLGRKELVEEIELVGWLLDQTAGKIKLRLDCNRSWSIEQLAEFLAEVDVNRLEYIEEPLCEMSRYTELPDECSFPLALDESLTQLQSTDIGGIKNLVAVVLKPTMLGIAHTIGFARAARNLGIKTTISSTFETSVGTTMLAHFASALSSPDHAAGLGTVRWFAQDLLCHPILIENERIDLNTLPKIVSEIRFDLLREVS